MTLQDVTESAEATASYVSIVRRWQDVPRRRPNRHARTAIIEHRTGSGVTRYGIAHEVKDHGGRP